MGVGSWGQGGAVPPWIFIDDTEKVEEGIMVLFFGLVFLSASPLEIFLPCL